MLYLYILFVFVIGILPFIFGFIRLFRDPFLIVYPIEISTNFLYLYLFFYSVLFIYLLYKLLKYYFEYSNNNKGVISNFIHKVVFYTKKPWDYVEFYVWRNSDSFFRYFDPFFAYIYRNFYKWTFFNGAYYYERIENRIYCLYFFFLAIMYFVLLFCVVVAFYDIIYMQKIYYLYIALFIYLLNQILYFIYCRLLSYLHVRRSLYLKMLSLLYTNVVSYNSLSDNCKLNFKLSDNEFYFGFDNKVQDIDNFFFYNIYKDFFFDIYYKSIYVLDLSNLAFLDFIYQINKQWDGIFSYNFLLELSLRIRVEFNGHSTFIVSLNEQKRLLEKHRLIISIIRLFFVLFFLLYVLHNNGRFYF